MVLYIREILLGLPCGGGSQTFVILYLPVLDVVALLPGVQLNLREKREFRVVFGEFNYWSYKLLDKTLDLQQGGPECQK